MENYHLTPAEIEELEARGFSREEIEGAEHIVYTCDSWIDQKFPTRGFKTGTIDAYYFDEKGKYTVKGQGKLAIYTYPKKEWEKIVEKQKDILNAQSNFWLQALINRFEKQFEISKSKKECIEQNLNNVVAFVTNTENRAPFSFPLNNGFTYAGSMDGLNTPKNEIAKWYQIVIVRGEYEAHTFINAADAKNGELPACVIWVTLYEFQNFLKGRLAEIRTVPTTPRNTPIKTVETPLQVFEEVVKIPEELPVIWQRLSLLKNPFVTASGEFIQQGKRAPHAVLFAFSQAMKSRDKLLQSITPDVAYKILCVRFNIQPTSSLRQVKRGKREYVEFLESFIDVLREKI